MRTDLKGTVIRRHCAIEASSLEGDIADAERLGYEDVGLVVHTAAAGLWYIRLPKKRAKDTTTNQTKLFNPKFVSAASVENMEESAEFSFVSYDVPDSWRYSAAELERLSNLQNLERLQGKRNSRFAELKTSRRLDFGAWAEKLREREELVADIFSTWTIEQLVEDEALGKAITQFHDPSKCSKQTLTQLALLKIMGCGQWTSLAPRWSNVGYTHADRLEVSSQAGAKPRAELRGVLRYDRFAMNKKARQQCRQGWVAFKRRNMSELEAYLLTCKKYWPNKNNVVSVKLGVTGKKEEKQFSIEPLGRRPTLSQFLYAVREYRCGSLALDGMLAGRRVRALKALRITRLPSVGQLGEVDSTSEDQTPVSEVSRLATLSSTWRCVYIEVRTGYILGVHSGHEPPSTMTNLLAILHGAQSKVEFCQRYGIAITDDEWHSLLCKTISADNGEMKSETSLMTMEGVEVSLQFARAWRGDDKPTVESNHFQGHKAVDHKLLGTTQGKQRERGDRPRDEVACRSHRENMIDLIRWILYYNNIEAVPHLVPEEMILQGNKGVTRRAIFEWCRDNGYFTQGGGNIEMLRTHCLPRLPATLNQYGVQIFNPLYPNRVVQGLTFQGPEAVALWRGRTLSCEVLLDPSDLSRCFLRRNGKTFELIRKEANGNLLTLKEHIDMQGILADNVALHKDFEQSSEADRLQDLHDSNRAAKKAKNNEANGQQPSRPDSGPKKESKRERTATERKRKELETLGFTQEQIVAAMQRDDVTEGENAPRTAEQVTAAQMAAAAMARMMKISEGG